MLIRTHLAIAIFGILVFISFVEAKLIFVICVLVATLIPDIDSRFSFIGNKKIMRILQFFTKHRGVIHSFTFLVLITLIFVLFLPVVAFGFFLGYGLHLFADSFTKQGITPFYPWKKKSCGFISSGKRTEVGVFVFFILVDLVLFFVSVF